MLGSQYISNMFKRGPTGEHIPNDDVAYASAALTMSSSFVQYNPDELLTRKGTRVYKQMMTDEQVKAVVRFHRDAVTGREWSFEDNTKLSDEENESRRLILTEIINRMTGSFKTKLDMVMSSLYNGFSLTEKTFDLIDIEGKAWVGIKSLKLKPFDTFYFNQDDYGNLANLEQNISGYRNHLDINKFIHHVQNADIHEYYGQSELREAYRAWWSKDTSLLLQNIYLERVAAGFTYATPKDGSGLTSSSPEFGQLKTVLSNIRSNSSMILPKGIELTVVHPSDTQAFERAVQGHDKSIAKALLMPNLMGLSEQGPNGSRALGDTQLEAFLWMLDAEAKNLEEVINEQLFQDLADQNFADGYYPKWKLHELSDSKMMEVVDKWTALVSGNAVQSISSDEAHIRSALKFPPADRDNESEAKVVDPQTALSGVQVTSMMEVVDRVALEKIPRETGIQILLNAFPVNIEQADLIMGEVGNGFKPKAAEPITPIEEGSDENDLSEGDPKEDDPGETIRAQGGTQRIEAKLAASKNRVSFAVIDKKSGEIESSSVDNLSNVIMNATVVLTDSIKTMDRINPEDIQKAKFASTDVAKIRKQFKRVLTAGWALGLKHAKDEVSRAAGEIMSSSFERLDTDAADYFDSSTFRITGKLTADMTAIIQSTLSNSIKSSATTADTVDQIYETFAAEGFLNPSDAQAQMTGLLTAREGATARLNTVVRTNVFEAINEARYSYFTDPELGDFVEALEYSAILDGRTTQICKHLDGQIHKASGEVWNGPYRPPNHYNCRSLLIPVTKFDKWSESDPPNQQPQAGFGTK